MENEIYILSLRNIEKTPAMSCVVEFEDVVVSSMDAKLLLVGEEIASANSILFLAAISIYSIDNVLRTINVSKFSAIYAYLFDPFNNYNDHSLKIRKLISSHYRSIHKLSHLFVPFRESVDSFHVLYDIPVSYVPLAADVIGKGGYDPHKIIDVNGYGRQPTELCQLLSERFNQRHSNRVFHHTNCASIGKINDFYAHRRLFWHLLRKSKIALVFDATYTAPNSFPFSFIPQRLSESFAAGCVIAGIRPSSQDMNELFNWPDAFIDLPDDVFGMFDSIESILQNYDLETIGRRNYAECLARHDWRHRLIDIANILDLPHLAAKVETAIKRSTDQRGQSN